MYGLGHQLLDEREAKARAAARMALRRFRALEGLQRDQRRLTRTIEGIAMVAAGWYRHHGQWRMSRMTDNDAPTVDMTTEESDEALESERQRRRERIEERFEELQRATARGEPGARQSLRRLLARFPWLTDGYTSMADDMNDHLIRNMAGDDPVRAELLRAESDRFRDELLNGETRADIRALAEQAAGSRLLMAYAQSKAVEKLGLRDTDSSASRMLRDATQQFNKIIAMIDKLRVGPAKRGKGRGDKNGGTTAVPSPTRPKSQPASAARAPASSASPSPAPGGRTPVQPQTDTAATRAVSTPPRPNGNPTGHNSGGLMEHLFPTKTVQTQRVSGQ
jgi:hypothetical protein